MSHSTLRIDSGLEPGSSAPAIWTWLAVSLCLGFFACAGVSRDTTPEPGPWQAGRVSVAFFVTTDCPIANAYAPEISRIAADHAGPEIDFYLVHVDPDLTPEVAARHAADYALELPLLFDRDHVLASSLGVTVTPEACIVGPHGELLYRGRIDDLFPALGKKRRAPHTRDLRDALEAVGHGRPIPEPWGEAVGCLLRRSSVLFQNLLGTSMHRLPAGKAPATRA